MFVKGKEMSYRSNDLDSVSVIHLDGISCFDKIFNNCLCGVLRDF